jgi:hypothetical protein
MLVPGYGGARYAPAYRYNGPPPGARWLAPRGQYLQGYLAPSAILGSAIAGALSQLPPPPVRYYAPAPPDAIAEIPNATTRQEVVEAIERLCELEPRSICEKMQRR